jgi:galactofuranose transport system substrate-binding protein
MSISPHQNGACCTSRLIVVLALAALLAACSGDSRPPATAGRPAVVLGFIPVATDGPWSEAFNRSVITAATESNIELRLIDVHRRQENQIEGLRSLITQRVDIIALTPAVETGWDTVLREVRAAGIPVILLDRTIEVSDDSLYVSVIGSDFDEQGRRAARWLIANTGDLSGEIDVVELQGTIGSAPANGRKRGFAEVIGADPRFRIIRSQAADFSREGGKLIMERFLQAEGDRIRVMFAHNDNMAFGGIEAIENAGLKPGSDILVVSIDGSREALEAMVAGKLNVSVECSPILGPVLMTAVRDLAAGRSIPRRIVTQEAVFSRETAARDLPNRPY